MADDKPQDPKQATVTCPVCRIPKTTPCGRINCATRKQLTVDIPHGLTFTGRIDTRTREWNE